MGIILDRINCSKKRGETGSYIPRKKGRRKKLATYSQARKRKAADSSEMNITTIDDSYNDDDDNDADDNFIDHCEHLILDLFLKSIICDSLRKGP